jgi:hypothetical protein
MYHFCTHIAHYTPVNEPLKACDIENRILQGLAIGTHPAMIQTQRTIFRHLEHRKNAKFWLM